MRYVRVFYRTGQFLCGYCPLCWLKFTVYYISELLGLGGSEHA